MFSPTQPLEPEDTGLDALPEIVTFGSTRTTAQPRGCAVSRAPGSGALAGLLVLFRRRRSS